jgi:pantetheine-phosphate adenylyltransferase
LARRLDESEAAFLSKN